MRCIIFIEFEFRAHACLAIVGSRGPLMRDILLVGGFPASNDWCVVDIHNLYCICAVQYEQI